MFAPLYVNVIKCTTTTVNAILSAFCRAMTASHCLPQLLDGGRLALSDRVFCEIEQLFRDLWHLLPGIDDLRAV